MRNLFFLSFCLFSCFFQSFSQSTSEYSFTQSSGTYTPISGTQIIHNNAIDVISSQIDIGFPFHMSGASFTSFYASSNGFIRLGVAPDHDLHHPISSNWNTRSIAGFGRKGRTHGGVFVETVGSAPDRVCIIQYNNYHVDYFNSLQLLNFQIRLYEASNVIQIVYGGSERHHQHQYYGEVGIRGSFAGADFNNRTTSSNWASSASSFFSNSTMLWSISCYPNSGLTYTWTPPSANYRYYAYNFDTGSTNWCSGTPRTVSVQIKNTGTNTWTDANPDINVGIKWGTTVSGWADYFLKTNAGNVAPGASATYNFTIEAKHATAPGPVYGANLTGFNVLTLDMINESNCLLGNNPGSCGTGWASMNMRMQSPMFSLQPPAGDPDVYGAGVWNGYVYKHENAGNPSPAFQSSQYRGFYTESEVFDRDWGLGSISGANICDNYEDRFHVRYRMNKNMPCGLYTFTVGADDGVRLSLDGGATWIINQWNDQGYETYSTEPIELSGSTNFVLEYYENASSARVSFDYTYADIAPTGVSAGSDEYICAGDAAQLNATGTAPPSTTYFIGNEIEMNPFGNSNPYPSTINMSGIVGDITNIRVFINDLTHIRPNDIDMVLFGPTGAHSIIMTDAIGGYNIFPPSYGVSGVNYIFEIGANPLPLSGFPQSGTYGVVNGEAYNGSGTPSAVTDADLNNFIGTNPNGDWTLYVYIDNEFLPGEIGSWGIEITTIPIVYSWSPASGLNATNIPNPVALPETTTTYTVTLSNGCSSATSNVTVFAEPIVGDPDEYGSDEWIGYVYMHENAGNPSPAFQSTQYRGFYTETETFDRDWGMGSISGANICGSFEDLFHVRYRMNKNMPCGLYSFTVGADDGVRLSIDGGATWVINQWNDQGYATYNTTPIQLDGPTNFVLEYYENAASARVSFDYNFTDIAPTGVSAGNDVTICTNEPVTLEASGTASPTVSSFSGESIIINDFGNANPYPSTINVSGIVGDIQNIRIFINNLAHTWPEDIDMVLFGPTGAHSIILTDAIGGGIFGASDLNYVFEIDATPLPTFGFPASGTYGVVNGESYSGTGTPGAVSDANLGNFIGTNPNGNWSLYVFDDHEGDGGSIESWVLEITTNEIQFSWSPTTGLSAADVPNPQALPETTTTYTVTVSNGCSSVSSNVTLTKEPHAGDPSVYGANEWIGYVYKHENTGAPSPAFQSDQYRGFYTETEIFDRNWGSGSISGTNICESYTDQFHIRYRMNKDMPCGMYTFTVGADDGIRLSVDGGATWIIDQWGIQAYTTFNSASILLNGSTNFVLEYFEGAGDARVSFNYTYQSLISGDPEVYGVNSWLGYVYKHHNAGAPSPAFQSAQYRGFYTESEIFDRDWGMGSISGANICDSYSDQFHVRYRMNKDMPCGMYTFTVGADDGVRLSVDGGATWIIDQWVNQGYVLHNSEPILLNGATDFVLEYFEDGGFARVSFNYSFTDVSPNNFLAVSDETICAGESALLNVIAPLDPVVTQFSSAGITINNFGNANPYPGVINVSGVFGDIQNIRIFINNLSHTWPQDIDMVLFGPTGAHSIIMTDAIGGAIHAISNTNYVFEIGATPLPFFGSAPSGTYGVFNGGSYNGLGTPSAVTDANLGNFLGTNPNGNWSLYVFDDTPNDAGSIQSWSIEFTTNPVQYSWSPATGLSATNIANPIASPETNTTYTVTVNNGMCPSSSEVTVSIEAPSLAPNTIYNLQTLCRGGTTELEIDGGTLAQGAQWEWFAGTCGGTGVGTGSSITVAPSSNTNYFVRASTGTNCPASDCVTLPVNLPASGTNVSLDGENATCYVNNNGWIDFYNASGRLIASVNSNGQDLGNVTATSYVNNTPYQTVSCLEPNNPSFFQAVAQRSFVITPEVQPTNPVQVRLYLLNSEVAAYQAAALATPNQLDNISGVSELHMTKISGGIGSGDPLDFCNTGGTALYVEQDNSGDINSLPFSGFSATSYLEFTIDSFSEFFPMSSGSSNSALPVELTAFSATCDDDKIQISWTTASELNASHYILQSSRDGQTWLHLVEIEAAGTTNQTSNYSYNDQNFGGLTYYRLVQVDNDGKQEIFGPISSNCALNNNLMTVHPNPASESFTVMLQSTENIESAQVDLVDMAGRVILSQQTTLNAGSTMLNFDVKAIQPGAYMIRVKGENDKFTPIRVVKM